MIRILVLILALFSAYNTKAAHIVGGDMIYECLGFDGSVGTFQITMTLYRDSKSGGAQFDAQARFGLFERNPGGTWRYDRTISFVPVSNVEEVLNVGSNPCLVIPPDIGVQKGVYTFELDLPTTDTEYMISYQRCCRNGSITNIVSPGETGSVTSITISSAAVSTCNDSPAFNDFPPIVICAGQDVNFDHSATDPNGDLLTYEFCAPLASGGTDGSGANPGDQNSCTGVTPDPEICRPPYNTVQFAAAGGYTVFNPMRGDPQVSINTNTGLITGVPTLTGQFVVGICVREFRDGVQIGEVRRDFQFNVTDCDDGVFAAIEADEVIDGKNFVVNSCGDNVINLTNASGLTQFIEEYYWEFDINGVTETFSTRDVSLTLPDFGTYTGVMQINNNVPAAGCRDTAEVTINLFPPIFAEFDFEYDTCVAGEVVFDNLSSSGSGFITENNWSFGDFNTSFEEDPLHEYQQPGLYGAQLQVTDINNCKDSISYPISYFPVPDLLIVEPSSFIGCQPAPIFFNNLSTPIDSTYDLVWDFGDGGTSGDISPTYIYEDVGTYSVSLEVTSPIGCTNSASFEDLIIVEPSPIAGFMYTPDDLSIFNSTIEIIDESEDAISWFYTLGDGFIAYDAEFTYTYQDTGLYTITQVVKHESGCTDTLSQLVDVKPILSLQMPNAFTPNNDGLNDDFRGKGILSGIQDYTLSIWNRWGERIFESNDPSLGWNGEYNNNGKQVMNGVYVYTLQYIGPRGDVFEQKGNVTLIR